MDTSLSNFEEPKTEESKTKEPKYEERKYKVVKRFGDGRTDVVYFLRCLWHLVNDPKSDHVVHWHPTDSDKFVVEASEPEMDSFMKEYDGFKGTWMTFRRSMYFYGFKKTKNIWYHLKLDKNDKASLKLIKRVSRGRKKKETLEQLRTRYMQIMMQQMQHIQTHNQLMSLTPQHYSPPEFTNNSGDTEMLQQMTNAMHGHGPRLAPLHHHHHMDMATAQQFMPTFITPPNFAISSMPPMIPSLSTGQSPENVVVIGQQQASFPQSMTTSFSPLELTAEDVLQNIH